MKKTFSFISPKKNRDRQIDWVKHEIKKYLGRERRKKRPEGVSYWDFDCRIGASEADAESIRVGDINPNISRIADEGHESFYIEVLAKEGKKKQRS